MSCAVQSLELLYSRKILVIESALIVLGKEERLYLLPFHPKLSISAATTHNLSTPEKKSLILARRGIELIINRHQRKPRESLPQYTWPNEPHLKSLPSSRLTPGTLSAFREISPPHKPYDYPRDVLPLANSGSNPSKVSIMDKCTFGIVLLTINRIAVLK